MRREPQHLGDHAVLERRAEALVARDTEEIDPLKEQVLRAFRVAHFHKHIRPKFTGVLIEDVDSELIGANK